MTRMVVSSVVSALALAFATMSAAAIPYPDAREAFDESLSVDQRVMAQIMLEAAGYTPVVALDHLSRSVYDGIKAFEIDNGFPADGVLNDRRMSRLISSAAPFLRQWGFEKVAYPGRQISVWVPLGLGLTAKENGTGLHFRDPKGRLSVDLVSVAGLTARSAHTNQIADGVKHAASVHYDSYKAGDDWFAISSTWSDGSDHYYRFHQDGARVTGFALEWNNDVENINAERIAVIMSGSLRSTMTGAPFVDPPTIEPEQTPVAEAPPTPPTTSPVAQAPSSPGSDPAGCSAVREATARLACFDAASGSHREASAESAPATTPAPPLASAPIEQRSVAITPPAPLGAGDIATMKFTYSDNQARVFRDFKDRRFSAAMPMDSVTENILSKGTFFIYLGSGHQVACGVSDAAALKFITDLSKGETIKVNGVVDDEVWGVVHLRDCELSRG